MPEKRAKQEGTINMTITIPGAAQGKIEGDFAFLTKRVRIPRGDILTVRPTNDGEGATVITERGAMRVCENYDALVRGLYGWTDESTPGAHIGANIGEEIARAKKGGGIDVQ